MMHSVVPLELVYSGECAPCLCPDASVLLQAGDEPEDKPQAILSTNPHDFLDRK